MCTRGPSLPDMVSATVQEKFRTFSSPRDNPDATESANPTLLVNKVHPPKYPWMTKPIILATGLWKSVRPLASEERTR